MKLYTKNARIVAGGLAFVASVYLINELTHNRLDRYDLLALAPPLTMMAAASVQAARDRERQEPSPRNPERIRTLHPPPQRELGAGYLEAIVVGSFLGAIPGMAYKPLVDNHIPQKIIEYAFKTDSAQFPIRRQE